VLSRLEILSSERTPDMGLKQKDLELGQGNLVRFVTTHWSVVVAAGRHSSPQAREALATLCRTYWYPLYAFVRRQGFSAEESKDLTQEFFVRLLEKEYLAVVDREKGRFRSFLLAACKHFLSNERDRARAKKRGGNQDFITLNVDDAESRYQLEPAHDLTPEKLFERRWAMTLLEQVLAHLRKELVEAGKANLFNQLKDLLTADKSKISYREAAEKLGTTEGAAKVAVHRLRKRYRELLHEEITKTMNESDSADDEIRQLFSALES
jgi:RNA polymerase sigma-70 factor (ECF subfamily)